MKKKLLSVMLAMSMVLGMTAVVMADDSTGSMIVEEDSEAEEEVEESAADEGLDADETSADNDTTVEEGDDSEVYEDSSALLTAVTPDDPGKFGENLSWSLEDGTLVISGTGDMPARRGPWMSYEDQIYSVIIKDGVTSICDYAFEECSQLRSVIIPGSVVSIGSYAFEECDCLESVTLSEGTTLIGEYAFENCPGLYSITIPGSVKSIGNNAIGWNSSDKGFYFTPGFVVYGYMGSEAENHAKVYGLAFKPLSRTAQKVTGTTAYSKVYGADAFWLDARTSGDGTLNYTSGNTSVATVSTSGKVKIRGAGTAKITVYAGETICYKKSGKFTITITVAKASQKVSGTLSYSKTYGNSAFVLDAETTGPGDLQYKSGNTSIAKVNAKGKVTITGVGTAKITIYAAETSKYKKSRAIAVTMKVVPKGTHITKLSSAYKCLTVNWKKQPAQITGYQIQYARNSRFTSASSVLVKDPGTVSKKIDKLKDQSKYYVRIRTYKTVDGKKYHSSWSAAESITTKL